MPKTRKNRRPAQPTETKVALTPETVALVEDVKRSIAAALDGTDDRSVIELVAEAVDRHPDADPQLKAELSAALSPDPAQAPSVGAALKMARHLVPQVLG